jgi:hypothetical protein
MRLFRSIAASSAAVVTALIFSLIPQLASAQATRTWVSGVGDDANPCSRTAPCKTFAGAISKTAANGEINCIDAGGFGGVTITKSLIIDCTGVHAGVLNSLTNGIIVNVAGGQVTLRHLSIDGAGNGTVGVRVLAAASVQIDNVIIRGQNGNGIEVATSAGATNVTVSNTLIRENAQHGIWVAPTSGAAAKISVSTSVMSANALTGIRVNDNSSASVTDSVLAGNGTSGASASSSGAAATISLDRVASTGNHDGGVLAKGSGAVIWLANTLLTGNTYGFYPPVSGGAYISFGNNRVIGNATDGVPTQTISQL